MCDEWMGNESNFLLLEGKKKRKQVSIETNSIPASVMHYNLWVNLIVTDARIHYTHTGVSIKRRHTLADNRSPDSKRTVYFLLSGLPLRSCRTCTRWTPPQRYRSQRCGPELKRNLQENAQRGVKRRLANHRKGHQHQSLKDTVAKLP